MSKRRKSGERGASSSDPRQEMKMTERLKPEAVKYQDYTKEYPKTIETTISVGHIKDLIEDELRRNNWIKDDEDIVSMSFGPIPWMKDHRNQVKSNPAKLNAYLNLTLPLHYTLNKQEQKKSEVKFRTYE